MNKAELRETVQRALDCPATIAERAVGAVLDGIREGLQKDGTVQILGFGTFQVKQRKARVGRNPTTGDPIQIPASMTVQFRAGKGLKESL